MSCCVRGLPTLALLQSHLRSPSSARASRNASRVGLSLANSQGVLPSSLVMVGSAPDFVRSADMIGAALREAAKCSGVGAWKCCWEG